MKCPHCLHNMHPSVKTTELETLSTPKMPNGDFAGKYINIMATVYTCPGCLGATIEMNLVSINGNAKYSSFRAFPRGGSFPPAPSEVPPAVAADYAEANEVISISPKASAALSRRCLQTILSPHGYTGRDLMRQVEAALAETDSTKSLPSAIRDNIDAIRNFGNFSTHPITDQNSLQIIEVEEGEAEWRLQLLLDLFDHYYVAPARAAKRRAALSTKLAAAGKPPMKQ